jgi:hypothetical protein
MLLPPGDAFRELVGGSTPGDKNLLKQHRITIICSVKMIAWRESVVGRRFIGLLEPALSQSRNSDDMRSILGLRASHRRPDDSR